EVDRDRRLADPALAARDREHAGRRVQRDPFRALRHAATQLRRQRLPLLGRHHVEAERDPLDPGHRRQHALHLVLEARPERTPGALQFVAALNAQFDTERRRLLAERERRQQELDSGNEPRFAAERRDDDWGVPPAPADLAERKVEITGPVDRKMIINALNSGASAFMADFEDATSPTWANVVGGQVNLADAVRGTIELETPAKTYRLGPR